MGGQDRTHVFRKTGKVLPDCYKASFASDRAASSWPWRKAFRLGTKSGTPHQSSQTRMEFVGCLGSYFTLAVCPGRKGAAAAISGRALTSCAASYVTPATS